MGPVLIVEDNKRLSASLTRGLADNALSAIAVGTGSEALAQLERSSHAAVILDLGLPDMDGVDLLETLRHSGACVPVLVLSARGSVDARVQLLDSGADDYLVKPFAFAELLARLRALIRRPPLSRRAPTFGSADALRHEHVGTRELTGAIHVSLSPRERALLQHLMRRAGRVTSRTEILAEVFGYAFDPGTNVIDVHIAHLRRKLGSENVRIETVRGEGYRLKSVRPSAGRLQ